jgi:hypothetical protein
MYPVWLKKAVFLSQVKEMWRRVLYDADQMQETIANLTNAGKGGTHEEP